ncbi:MAG: hypothetical protein HRU75_14375 [Planctomycetia bacterium]|nr:MAG: hypothetical protein HRU75_14375 [Planctomycetia bacterium]
MIAVTGALSFPSAVGADERVLLHPGGESRVEAPTSADDNSSARERESQFAGLQAALLHELSHAARGVNAQRADEKQPAGKPAAKSPDKPAAKPGAKSPDKPAAKPPARKPAPAKQPARRTARAARPAASAPATQPAVEEPATQPALNLSDLPLGEALQRLASVRSRRLTADESALRCAIEFALAVASGNEAGAARLIDATGYQPLLDPAPSQPGRVPEPAPLIPAARAAEWLRQLPRCDLSGVRVGAIPLLDRRAVYEFAPFAAEWMLPSDRALLLTPEAVGGWVADPACVVVRVRGSRATVVGGTLLEALADRAGGR